MTGGVPFVRSVPRWGVIRPGIAAVVVGVAALVLGAALFAGRDAVAVAAPAARGAIPGEARFEAKAGRYAILLDRLSVTGPPSTTAVATTVCTVRRADGSSLRIRGSRQGTATETDVGRSIGAFDARRGETTVACAYDDAPQRARARFVVARRASSLSVAIVALIAGGLVIGASGAALITWGLRRPVVVRSE